MSDMSNTYKKVIDILTEVPCVVDYKAIAIGLAKQHPELFLKLHNNATPVSETTRNIYRNIESDMYIEAIKKLREATGCGLKEAKDVIINIRDAYKEERRVCAEDMPAVLAPFYGGSRKLVDELINFANQKRGF